MKFSCCFVLPVKQKLCVTHNRRWRTVDRRNSTKCLERRKKSENAWGIKFSIDCNRNRRKRSQEWPLFFSIWLREIFNLFYRLYTSTSNNFYNLENSRKFHKIKNSETQKQINYAKKKKFDQSMNSANSHWKFMMKWPKFLNNRRKQTFLKSVMIQK